jgi:pimeloyl-ACP methyl ester carboxylesterase
MIAPLAKFIDWYALQSIWAIRLRSVSRWNNDAKKSELEEAIQFLKGPDFIPVESQPAQVEFNGRKHFTFPTPRSCDVAQNNVVYGRLYRCGEHWRERPVIILLHGGGDFFNHRYRFPWIIPACNRAGFNAATIVAPYHFQRCRHPPARLSHLRMAQAFAQSVAEIRALTGWFLAQGCPSVALWGISLGGWSAGLTVSHDTRIASAVLSVPGVRMDYKFSRAEQVIWRSVREALWGQSAAREAMSATPLNLILNKPVIPRENILLIEGVYDQFVEMEAIEELWQKWQQPEIWRLPHGHVSWMFAPGLTGRVLRWLACRAESPLANPRTAAL